MRIPKAVIPKFAGVKTDLLTDADNSDLRKAIKDAVPEAVEQTKELAPYFKATNERETCKRIFDFLKSRVKYKADDWRQVVQLPSAILRKNAVADCKSLSLFTAAILQNLGIPWHFVLASYTDSPVPGHIYCVTDSGCIIDVVWGKFDEEKEPNHKYKMKVSYLSGISGPMIAGTGSGNSGYCGIGATEGAVEWAKRNQVWQKYNVLQQAKIAAMKLNPLAAAARRVMSVIITGNAGGLASMLKDMRIEAGKNQAGWNAMRSIELKWLENGGNPNELYEDIDKGAAKRPKGKKMAELIKRKKAGQDVPVKLWIQAVISAVFGKKYDPNTDKITGFGIGDPTTLGAMLTSAAVWQPILAATITAITAAIVTKIGGQVEPAADETTGGGATFPGGSTAAQGAETTTGKISTTTIIIGAAAALGALWYFTKKK
jgi:hypothetical protein